jgi:lipoprotein signal peptidase
MKTEGLVHLFHIWIVGGLFLYVGIRREKIPSYMYPILLVLGGVIILYHLYKAYRYIQQGKPYWVNLIHILFIGPLLLCIGYQKEETKRKYFELLLMFGFASIGYHGYYLFADTI